MKCKECGSTSGFVSKPVPSTKGRITFEGLTMHTHCGICGEYYITVMIVNGRWRVQQIDSSVVTNIPTEEVIRNFINRRPYVLQILQ